VGVSNSKCIDTLLSSVEFS